MARSLSSRRTSNTLKLSTNIFHLTTEERGLPAWKRKSNSPARPLREQYIIRMLLWYPFHEFHASEILPVSHRLFEQSFVGAGKISIDLVRDHPVIPHPLLPSRRRSPRPARQSRGPALPRHLFRPVLHVVELDRTQLPIVKRHHLVRRLVQVSSDRRNLSTAMPPLRRSAKILPQKSFQLSEFLFSEKNPMEICVDFKRGEEKQPAHNCLLGK